VKRRSAGPARCQSRATVYKPRVEADPALAIMMAPPLGLVLATVWGLVWGSFFNVAAYRLADAALADESETWLGSALHALRSLKRLFHPPSACPRCHHAIRWFHNVPLVGWLALRGRCYDCGAPISAIYPAVELVAGVLAAAVYQRFVVDEPAPPLLQLARFMVYFYFSGALFVLAIIDAETTLLPLAITLPAIPFFFLCGRALDVMGAHSIPTGDQVSTVEALAGFGVGFGSLFLLRHGYKLLTGREGLGGGDEMLVGLVGALLGWRALPVTLFVGATLGTLIAVPSLLLARRRADQGPAPSLRHVEVPFGPFLASAAMVYLLFGKELWGALEGWVNGGS
jgi:leader peptidase (prepilin peptidase)/N-methyltransferase